MRSPSALVMGHQVPRPTLPELSLENAYVLRAAILT